MSALMQAYTINGGGFSHAAAGTSIESVKQLSDEDNNGFCLALAQDEDVLRRMSAETARLVKEAETKKDNVAAELAEEEKKLDELWEQIGKMALGIQQRAEAEIDLVERMKEAFL